MTVNQEFRLRYFGWVVLFGAVVQLTFSPGPVVFGSWGLFAPQLGTLLKTSRGGVMLALTAFNIGSIVAAPLTGRLIDRFGVRVVLVSALVFFMAGFWVVGYGVKTAFQLYVVSFIWGALSLGAQSLSFSKLLAGWFVERRGLALGIAAAGLGLGYAVVPPLVSWAITTFTWRGAFLVLCAVIGLGPLLVAAPLAKPAPPTAVDTARVSSSGDGVRLGDALRTPTFWAIAGAVLIVSIALTGITPHLFLLARDQRMTLGAAAASASLYGVATIVGRLAAGALFDRFSGPKVCMGFFSSAVVGFALLACTTPGHEALLWAAIGLLGLGFGAETDVIGFLTAGYFGQKHFGQIYGCLLSAFIFGAALGPPALGFGHDVFGSYSPAFWIASALCLCGVGLIGLLPAMPSQKNKAREGVAPWRPSRQTRAG